MKKYECIKCVPNNFCNLTLRDDRNIPHRCVLMDVGADWIEVEEEKGEEG